MSSTFKKAYVLIWKSVPYTIVPVPEHNKGSKHTFLIKIVCIFFRRLSNSIKKHILYFFQFLNQAKYFLPFGIVK